jgi:hypothetical protein
MKTKKDREDMNVEQILSANKFEHRTYKNADGTAQIFRRNGKTKLWKTRPHDFQIPVKRGLKEYGYITQDNYMSFIPV